MDKLWIPFIFFVNADGDFSNPLWKSQSIYLYSNGTIQVIFVMQVVSRCAMDHSRFPFDTQQCYVIMTSLDGLSTVNATQNVVSEGYRTNFGIPSDWQLVQVVN
jgi:hypothetical protein